MVEKVCAPCMDRKPPLIFCFTFIILISLGLTRNDYSACHPLERGDPQVFEKSGFPFSRE